MKISNDILKIYGLTTDQKAEGDKILTDGKKGKSNPTEQSTSSIKANNTDLPQELKRVLESVFGENISLDKKSIEMLKIFYDRFPGTLDEKINIIKNLMEKGLDINIKNLELMYEALYGKETGRLMSELGANPTDDLESLIAEIKNMMAQGASWEKIFNLLESYTENSKLTSKAKEILTKIVAEGRQATAYKMEDLAEKIVIKGLKDIEKEEVLNNTEEKGLAKSAEDLQAISNNIREGSEREYVTSLLEAVGLSGKDYLVTEITTRLKEAAGNFKTLKKEMANNLDMAVRYIKESSNNSIYNAKATLQKTIEVLDKTILKSDIALFADMKTEKELVKADGQLQKAKNLLDKGEYEKAWKLVENIKNKIESLNWKPSNTRLVHFASFKDGLQENSNQQEKLQVVMKSLINNFKEEDCTSRKVYEAIKLMGVDHEGETARFLAGEKIDEESLRNNIKSLLLEQTDNGKAVSEFIEKITGSQLLNKDGNSPLQTMFFSLPFLVNGRVSDMKVYINSKKNGHKLDWQNCSIFFLVDTAKLGETGILLQASGGNLNITIKNDREDLKDKAQSLIYGFKDNLKELGYDVGNVNFASLNGEKEDKQPKQTPLNKIEASSFSSIKKGIDIRI